MPYLILIIALLVNASAFADNTLSHLSALEWKYRIILIDDSVDTQAVVKQLRQEKSGVEDRDILWFVLNASTSTHSLTNNYSGSITSDFSSNIYQRYFSHNDVVVLIGKDGGIKLRAKTFDLQDIFKRIDSMPMRQQEMNEK